jgi:hypothetical protein
MSTVALASAAGAAQRGINAAKGDFFFSLLFPPSFSERSLGCGGNLLG